MRRMALLVAIGVVVAACGGDASAEPGGSSSTSVPATEQPNDADSTADQTNAPTTEPGNDDAKQPALASTATITMEGSTYYFVADEGGECDPDSFGNFRAFMAQVDSEGVPRIGQMSFSANAAGEGLFGGELDGVLWTAGKQDDGGTIDSVDVDGNRMSGTATFVRPDTGESHSATFEVTCAGE